MTVADRIRAAIAALPGPVAIAVSGGADSGVVAWAAAEAGVSARCLHVDHGLATSATMRAAAVSIATALGLALEVLQVAPSSASEADLRTARYEALLGALTAGEVLVTAHTEDDQAETMLLNLLRGTGLPGLGGIPARRGPIRRPILDVARHDIRSLADRLGLPYVDDPENTVTDHLRNRVRNDLIPRIEAEFSPSVRTNLRRTASGVSEALAPMIEAVRSVRCEVRDASLRAAVGPLMAVDASVRRWVLREMIAHVRGPYPPSREEVDRVEAALVDGSGTDLADTLHRFRVKGPWYELSPPGPAPPGPAPVSDGGCWGAFRFHTRRWEGGPLVSKWRFVHAPGAYTVRAVAGGDRIEMATGHKDAREAIREAGIDAVGWPVVTDASERVVWIPGVRHSAWSPTGSSGYVETIAEEDAGWAAFQL